MQDREAQLLHVHHGLAVLQGHHLALAGAHGHFLCHDILDHETIDFIEIGLALLPVVRVFLEFRPLVFLEVDEYERPGADRVLPDPLLALLFIRSGRDKVGTGIHAAIEISPEGVGERRQIDTHGIVINFIH